MVAWLANLRNRSLSARLAVLILTLIAVYSLAAPVAIQWGGSRALAAAAVAAGLCLLGAAAAIVTTDRLRGPAAALAALWLGTILRMGVPLAAGLAIHLHGGLLAQAGLLWYLLVFYPAALIIGTIVSLPPKEQRPGQTP
jgi:hypothetical protein